MGIGIWAMHYVGMLAFSLPVPLEYDWPTVLLSLFCGIWCSVFALLVVSRRRLDLTCTLVAGAMMGWGIAALHSLGMAAMRWPAEHRFDSRRVTLSGVFAIAFSWAALRARGRLVSGYPVASALRYRRHTKRRGSPRISSQITRAGPYSAKDSTIPSTVSDALR
jgi:NO-binding membrane sensor protein with MHYT domain